jgi:hypothetical protein
MQNPVSLPRTEGNTQSNVRAFLSGYVFNRPPKKFQQIFAKDPKDLTDTGFMADDCMLQFAG